MQWPPLSSSDREFLRRFKFCPERAWDDDAAVSDAAVSKVMLLGDIHNSRRVLDAALRTASDEGCDVVVQVGDSWMHDCTWQKSPPEHAGAMCSAVHARIPVVVVDGNHEVWPCLSEFLQRDDTVSARDSGRPLHLGGSLWWADRGSTWTWSGARFGALGGSASPDRWRPAVAPYRREQETTTREDLERLLDNAAAGLDVLICHDAPEGTTGLISGMSGVMPPYLQYEADTVQALLQSAVDETQPVVIFHGHSHQQNRCRLNDRSDVIGLKADSHPGCVAILSISDLQTDDVDMFQRSHRASGGDRSRNRRVRGSSRSRPFWRFAAPPPPVVLQAVVSSSC